ncbi:MAG TPA: YgjP-like metallopeptidase domain-containing protein, partial [Rhodoferax sp.]
MQVRQVQDIEYQLLPGTNRQTTDIVIERDGVVRVRPPRRMTSEQVDATVFSKRMWIYRNLAEWQDLNVTRVAREWVNGETFLYLGSGYRLSLVDKQEEALKLKDGRFQLRASVMAQG